MSHLRQQFQAPLVFGPPLHPFVLFPFFPFPFYLLKSGRFAPEFVLNHPSILAQLLLISFEGQGPRPMKVP